jgi:hypothetical protein
MDKILVLNQLKQFTGDLQPSSKSQTRDLKTLERRLAEQIIFNPQFNISGTNLHKSEANIKSGESMERFAHMDDLFEENAAKNIKPVLAFRRETSMQINLLGNSVAEWGNGLAANESLGPFIDKNGTEFYFDFFFAVKMVQVFITGLPYPVLLVPIRGMLSAKKNYSVVSGSVWIASNFITRKSAQLGYYTGLKVKSGTMDFEINTTLTDGKLYSASATKVKLHLNLDQNVVAAPSTEAGLDATKAEVHLPETLDLEFNLTNSKLKATDAKCITFGSEINLGFETPAQEVVFYCREKNILRLLNKSFKYLPVINH